MNRLPLLLAAIFALTGSAITVRTFGNDDGAPRSDTEAVATLLELVLDADAQNARECLTIVTTAIQNGELAEERVAALRERLEPRLSTILQDADHPLRLDAALLMTAWGEPQGIEIVRAAFVSDECPTEQRLAALQALIAARVPGILESVKPILASSGRDALDFQGRVVSALGRLESPELADFLLEVLKDLDPELQSRAMEVLTQRPEWTVPLLSAIAEKQFDKNMLNLNQLRRIASFKDPEIRKQFAAIYGAVRDGRNPARERVVKQMNEMLRRVPGDPHRGTAVFKKVCAQCHKLYGEGSDVGPDITSNGRNDWEQLLSNVFDPSLVIGPGYQARLLLTVDGRVLTGLPVEESDQRVVLKLQGGKVEAIAREDIDEYRVSEISLMPEEIEKQLTQQEIADLMSLLALDRPPDDPQASFLPGAPVPAEQTPASQ